MPLTRFSTLRACPFAHYGGSAPKKKIFGNLKFLKIYYLCPNLSFIISFCDSINFMAKKALNRSILGVLDSYVTAVYREKIKKIMTFFLQM